MRTKVPCAEYGDGGCRMVAETGSMNKWVVPFLEEEDEEWSNIDGCVHRNGWFLYIEQKHADFFRRPDIGLEKVEDWNGPQHRSLFNRAADGSTVLLLVEEGEDVEVWRADWEEVFGWRKIGHGRRAVEGEIGFFFQKAKVPNPHLVKARKRSDNLFHRMIRNWSANI